MKHAEHVHEEHASQTNKVLAVRASAVLHNLKRACHIDSPQPGQTWRYWPVRLFKAAKCAKLFGFEAEFESLKKFAQDLMANHDEDMTYCGHDLGWLFRD